MNTGSLPRGLSNGAHVQLLGVSAWRERCALPEPPHCIEELVPRYVSYEYYEHIFKRSSAFYFKNEEHKAVVLKPGMFAFELSVHLSGRHERGCLAVQGVLFQGPPIADRFG